MDDRYSNSSSKYLALVCTNWYEADGTQEAMALHLFTIAHKLVEQDGIVPDRLFEIFVAFLLYDRLCQLVYFLLRMQPQTREIQKPRGRRGATARATCCR